MQDEKYVNYYIETLTDTMTDCVVRNVSMQANMKLKDDIIKQQADKIGEFAQVNEELFNELEDLKKKSSESETAKVNSLNVELTKKGNDITALREQHRTELKRMEDEIRKLNSIKVEYEKIKGQVTHVETFRTQLVKEREAHETTKLNYEKQVEELSIQIELLQNPPKKKKTKAQQSNLLNLAEEQQDTAPNGTVNDGGSF